MASTRPARRWFVRGMQCDCCGLRLSVYGTPWGVFLRPGRREADAGTGRGRDLRAALAASLQAMEAGALLEYLAAPPVERERLVLCALQQLAAARLDEATLLEALDESPRPDDPELPQRLAAARARVVAGARMLLRMRAAEAPGELEM